MERIINLRQKTRKSPLEIKNEEKDNSISWDADYGIYSSLTWQKSMIGFLIGLIFIFILFKQSLFSIIFFGFVLVIFIFYFKRKQKIIKVSLEKNHLQFNKTSISYRGIESFWIIFEPYGLKELSLKQKKWHSTYLKIPIHCQNPIQIRNFLLNYMPEEYHEDSIFDILGRKFGI